MVISRRGPAHWLVVGAAIMAMLGGNFAALAQPGPTGTEPIVHKIEAANERVEMLVRTSRLLTMDKKIPRAQVNNPDLLDLTPTSAKQVLISAKKAGITQVSLWDEDDQIHTVLVIISNDSQELEMIFKREFPTASIKVSPTATSVILRGYADRPETVSRAVRIAEDYYPKVINNITVGGAQQVLLHVKVMEVSRTKLRDVGFDFANVSGAGNSFVKSGVSGLLKSAGAAGVTTTGLEQFSFGIINSNSSFFGVLAALQRHQLMKILAEPTLIAVSGRPAMFQEGGEIPILVPQSLGTVSVNFRPFGTRVDFVPIALGNGNVHLEVRPEVSEIDNTISVTLNGSQIPGFRTRKVDTAVEMKAGQTLALAGLIQTRIETTKSGLPWISDVPYLGVPFRRIAETHNEVELLIMVRPEIVEALDCDQAPPTMPGMNTESPRDCDLIFKGHMEVPRGYYDQKTGAPVGPGIQGGVPVQEMPAPEPAVQPEEVPMPPAPTLDPPAEARGKPRQPARVAGRPRPSNTVPAVRSARTVTPGPVAKPAPRPPLTDNRSKPSVQQAPPQASSEADAGGFIGPLGYDVNN